MRKRVLFLVTSLYGGGAERVCCLVASGLAGSCDVTVAYLNEKPFRYPLDERVRTVRIRLKEHHHLNPLKRFLRPYDALRFCRSLKKEFRPDVTVSFLVSMNALNVFSKHHDRVICSERCNPVKWEPEKFPLTKYLYKKADHVIFQTYRVRNLYNESVRRHASVIRNPVRLAIRADEVRRHRIVTMGRLVPQKNQAMLIRSFADFYSAHSDYTLSVYGEGQLMEELRELARSEGVADAVVFHGNVPDVHEQIRDAEIFVLSSDFEGLSNALLECLTMGIACISTACEGSEEIIRDGENGLLVPVGDGAALTRALIRLAEDPPLRRRLGEQAAKDAEQFSADRIIRQWEEVFFDGLPE